MSWRSTMSPPTPTSVGLINGLYFDYLAPDPGVIDLDVLEHGLRVPRFNNQTTRPITTLEHSLRVDRVARELGATGPWPLLHDAHEALVPWGDCLRPGKTDEMRAIENDVDLAICAALRIELNDEHRATVRTADNIALYFEAMLWAPTARGWAHGLIDWDEWPHEHVIERFMPLIAPRPRECWRTEVERLLRGGS